MNIVPNVTKGFACLFALIVFASGATTCMAAAEMKGKSRFSFSERDTKVTFGCDGITNPSSENAAGTLQLSLWAFDKPYKSGGARGTKLAVYQLKGLAPGAGYGTISTTQATKLPSVRKAYAIAMILSEYKDGKYVVVDSLDFSGTTVLEPLPLFSMSGPWSFKASNTGGTIEVQVAKISHTRPGTTGALKLGIMVSRQPWSPTATGYMIGVVKKNPLQANFSYNNVKNTAQYTRPPPGKYYVTLILSENINGTYYRQATLTMSKPTEFN